MTPRATEIAAAILRVCQSSNRMAGVYIDDIIDGIGNKHDVVSVIKGYLLPMNYVKKSDDGKYYKITELGRGYLSKQGTGTFISTGDYAQIANNSPQAQQTISIDINDYSADIQAKVNEIHESIVQNDKAKFKKALFYILDKGIDVSIALALAYSGAPR